jgi:uncharacterized membrane protein YjjB (DUF3815 family)
MRGHEVALWSGVAAFFGSVIATGIFDAVNADRTFAQFVGACLVGFFTAGLIYAKERLNDAKKDREKRCGTEQTGDEKRR